MYTKVIGIEAESVSINSYWNNHTVTLQDASVKIWQVHFLHFIFVSPVWLCIFTAILWYQWKINIQSTSINTGLLALIYGYVVYTFKCT